MEKMRLDPKKVNMILATLPLKLIHGVVQNLKITADVKNLKLSVSIDLINLTMYLDDHSQYQRYNENLPQMYLVGGFLLLRMQTIWTSEVVVMRMEIRLMKTGSFKR